MRVLALLVALALVAGGCSGAGEPAAGGEPSVVASVYPLAFVVEEVGGDLVDLENLTPPGAEPHDLELTAGQVRALGTADLVVYLGAGFQPSVEDALAETDATKLNALEGQQALLEPPEHEDERDGEGEGHEDEGVVDPHVWLDPNRLARIATSITEELVTLDPANSQRFRNREEDLRDRLAELDAEFRQALSGCARSTFVTTHEAFGYLADAYGLEEIGIAGIDPEAEPSPRRLAEVAELVRANDITTIYVEVLVAPDTAEVLAREVGITTATLDPLEGPPESGDYFTAMRGNLDALRNGLGCR